MDILSSLSNVNYLAVLIATIASFVLGFLWFGPALFGKKWMQAVGLSEVDMKQENMPKTISIAFVTVFIVGVVMAMLFGGAGLTMGIQMGLILGVGIIAMQRTMHAVYEQKNRTYIWTTIGFDIILFATMGAIIGAW